MKSEQINELAAALSQAQGEMTSAIKDSNNPFFRSKYANLNSYLNCSKGPLCKYGLSISQIPTETETGVKLVTILLHSSGQWLQSSLPINVKSDGKTNELQVFGSVLSYLKRYVLSSMLGIGSDDDDDGNSAKDYQVKQEPAAPPAPKLVTASQADELRAIVSKCSPKLKENIDNLLKDRKINGFNELGEILYKSLYDKAVKDAEFYQADIAAQEQVAV